MSKEETIRVVLLEPHQMARTVEVKNTLEGLQELVKGNIEPFYPFEEEVCSICNDEGKINGMEPNRAIYDDDHNMIDVLFGPGFICSCGGEDFGSLSDEQIERYTEMFKRPEYIFKAGGEIQAVPYTPHEAPAQDTPTQEAAGEAR